VTVRVEPVESLEDPRLDVYRNVRDAQLRSDLGLFMAEGRLNVERLLASPRYRARSVFVTSAALRGIARSLEPPPSAAASWTSSRCSRVRGVRRAVSWCSRTSPIRTTSAPSSATHWPSAAMRWR
jgi:hypothetical protein